MPMVLFPWTTVIAVLVLLLVAAVPVLRSRWALAGVAALVIAHAVLLTPRFLPDGRQVPAHAVELRMATIN
ncbi:endonuclease/exonuclease/phosphatase family protein, partial [Streptomyces sp. SID7499]|nr:endonuclease/exonuclease/phosphatase family protein [Streptomyces sp. SID7499]